MEGGFAGCFPVFGKLFSVLEERNLTLLVDDGRAFADVLTDNPKALFFVDAVAVAFALVTASVACPFE